MDEAEAQLMAMVHEFQIEDELKEAAGEGNGDDKLGLGMTWEGNRKMVSESIRKLPEA